MIDWTALAVQKNKKVLPKRTAKQARLTWVPCGLPRRVVLTPMRRSASQCRDRYRQHVNKGAWSREEYESLVAQRRAGERCWTLIAKVMGTGRSEHDVKNKFNAMRRKQRFSDDERTGAAAPLLTYVLELRAATVRPSLL